MNKEYNFGEDVRLVVGDEKQPIFYPRMKIKRWDNEVNFSIGVISKHKGSNKHINDRVEWDDGHGTKARFYEMPDGSFEFDIELSDKPESNVIVLSIETKGLDFYYQPELTEEEKNDIIIIDGEDVCRYHRPDKVIGSYAVYHSTKSGNYIGGNNYRAGKAFHIYRPKIIDSEEKFVWGELNIDEKENILNVKIPQEFLDNAVYPIRQSAGLNFGFEVKGGTERAENHNDMAGSRVQSSIAGTANSITTWIKDHNQQTHAYGIYSDSGGDPNAYIDNTLDWEITNGYDNWKTLNFNTPPDITASTYYWLITYAETYTIIYYDAVPGGVWNSPPGSYPDWETPLAAGDKRDRRVSIYCTYTYVATGTRTPRTFNGSLWGPFRGPI